MANQGSWGTISASNDFNGNFEDVTWAATSVDLNHGTWLVSVNEGTLQQVLDESGGVLQFLTDTGDNDNATILQGVYDPSKGVMRMEARFKVADDVANTALFVGFSQTMVAATPVMPAEFATATMTYNGTGGMLGMQWDSDATTNAWKAVCGDAGAVAGSASFGANGTDATDAAVADEYDIVRVELHPGGYGECWLNEELVAAGATGLTTTDLFYAVCMCENRAAAALEFEVDYMKSSCARDWTP